MTSVLAILGALGGCAAFLGAIAVVVRAVFREVSAIESNTVALDKLSDAVSGLDGRITEQGERISRLEGRLP